MPFVKCIYSGDEGVKNELCRALSKAVAAALIKPEAYVCMHVECSDSIMFAGTLDPCSFITVHCMGGSLVSVVGPLTSALEEVAGVPSHRCFINFTRFGPDCFALDGELLLLSGLA
ncbi:Tautomerase/MIF superfamily, partial [Ochromonadaceae sp. CCMP2298]